MDFKGVLFLFGFLFISIQAKNIIELDLNAEIKDQLREQLNTIKNISGHANNFITTVPAQMDAFNASAQLRLYELEGKVLQELNDISRNEEYARCVEPRRKDLRIIVQKTRSEYNQCYRIAVKGAHGVRNETIKSFNNLEIYGFIEKCLEKQLKDDCTENEAQRILKETNEGIELAYKKLFSSVADIMIIVNEAQVCFRHKEDNFLDETEKFLAAIYKECVLVK